MGGLIVGYDGSDGARAALEYAAELSRTLSEPVTVVFGFEPPRLGGEVADYAHALTERGEEVLEHARHQAGAAGIEAETLLVHEQPAKALVDVAREREARMIVVGTHGEHPLRGALVGSTPPKLISIADTPVLVVPAGEE